MVLVVLVIKTQQEFRIETHDKDLAQYDQYELICSSDANPPAEYTWKIRHPNMTSPIIKHWKFNQSKQNNQRHLSGKLIRR